VWSVPTSKCAAYATFEREEPQPSGGNVLRGVRWSPDGCCLLTGSEDNVLRIFNLPQPVADEAYAAACGAEAGGGASPAAREGELAPALRIESGESIYDFCW